MSKLHIQTSWNPSTANMCLIDPQKSVWKLIPTNERRVMFLSIGLKGSGYSPQALTNLIISSNQKRVDMYVLYLWHEKDYFQSLLYFTYKHSFYGKLKCRQWGYFEWKTHQRDKSFYVRKNFFFDPMEEKKLLQSKIGGVILENTKLEPPLCLHFE